MIGRDFDDRICFQLFSTPNRLKEKVAQCVNDLVQEFHFPPVFVETQLRIVDLRCRDVSRHERHNADVGEVNCQPTVVVVDQLSNLIQVTILWVRQKVIHALVILEWTQTSDF